jgi:hypothetical protein
VIKFEFPVYHKSCDACPVRYQCLTTRTRQEFDRQFIFYKPYYFGISYFKAEPYNWVSYIELRATPTGGMRLEINV